ncbi:MAG TPA: Hsp20/alpha crystallin family protein [Bacteroidota bacterium]|nr:Hsp20/alpha crystallin family protein [Bacteroidota bacterium]
MTLIRWNPTRDLTAWSPQFHNVRREMTRAFDNFFHGDVEDDGSFGLSLWTPAVDIKEQDDEYVVNVELPGVKKDEVKITIESNVLTIRGEKKEEKNSKEGNYQRVERSYGSFQRSFTLPSTVKSDKIEAAYNDGVLTVTLPKAEEAKPKQIEVKVK